MKKKIFGLIMVMFILILISGCNKENYYIVTFVGLKDEVLKTEKVKEKEDATAPIDVDVLGYEFIGWDKKFNEVKENLTVNAIYETLLYELTYKGFKGVVLKTEILKYDEVATAPKVPIIEGYEFVGWDKEFADFDSDLIINAIYKKNDYTVTFLGFDDIVLKEEPVEFLDSATAPIAPIVDGFSFIGWDEEYNSIKGNLTVKAIYVAIYNVTFYDNDGEVLDSFTIEEGKSATAPYPPSIIGYQFVSWDKDFSSVTTDLEVHPIYELKEYNVTFISDGVTVAIESVNYGGTVSGPELEKEGFLFVKWDRDFSNVTGNLTVNALWQKISSASYVESITYNSMSSFVEILKTIVKNENLVYTITDVKENVFRNTNEIVYYNNSDTFNTNIWGYEVAVDSNGLVIEKATNVNMPFGGFVISGHGTSISILENRINIGDYVTYRKNEVKIYRDSQVSAVIGLGIELARVKEKIIDANNNYLALDYVDIERTFNEAVDIYNALVRKYSSEQLKKAEKLTLSINFMLIEATSVTVRAMWHYPTRTSGYSEGNTFEVQRFLDKVKSMGINRIYLNTNFNGGSVYKSAFLSQRLTGLNIYEGYFDYLECFIAEAHLRKIEVHAWTNTLIAGDGSNNVYYSSKGWLLKGFNNEDNYNNMYYLDISNPEVEIFLSEVFTELAKYDLDGIEYDFIRFPVSNGHNYSNNNPTSSLLDWGWTDTFTTKFKTKYNLSGDLKELFKTDSTIRKNWFDFKRETLNNFVEMLSNTIKETNPNIKISAAVMAEITGAKNTYLQDWETWIINGDVDELNPMIYTANNSSLKTQLQSMMNVVGDLADIVAGIFPDGSGGEHFMSAEQISIIEALKVSGSSKFSSRQLFGTPLENTFLNMDRSYIVLPTASKKEILNAYILDLLDKIEGYYFPKTKLISLNNIVLYLNSLTLDKSPTTAMIEIKALINNVENPTIKNNLLLEFEKINKLITN